MSDLTDLTGLPETPERAGLPAVPVVPASIELGDATALLDPAVDPVEALRDDVGRVVVAHPGVLRLEPTLLGAVRGLGQRSGLDGIQLAVRGRVADLDVNVATRSDHQALASVSELHRLLVDLVTDHGFVPGTVEISVLAVEEITP